MRPENHARRQLIRGLVERHLDRRETRATVSVRQESGTDLLLSAGKNWELAIKVGLNKLMLSQQPEAKTKAATAKPPSG